MALIFVSAAIAALGAAIPAMGHGDSYTNFSPTQGDVNAGINVSGQFPGYAEINSLIIWQTTSSCNTSSALYTMCAGLHPVFEHNVELSNYHTLYPQEYRFAKWPEAYSSNFPGRKYLDNQVSDSGIDTWTVGTLDGSQFQPYTWYYGNIVGTPDYPGPNWYQLRFEVGNIDQPGCGIWVSYDWCMLIPQHGYPRIPMTLNYTFPNHLYWWGQ